MPVAEAVSRRLGIGEVAAELLPARLLPNPARGAGNVPQRPAPSPASAPVEA
jgi:hypothetical protein